MISLRDSLKLLLPTVLAGGALSGAVAIIVGGFGEVKPVGAAILIGLSGALFAAFFFARHGAGVGAVLVVTGARLAVTTGLTGFIAWKFSTLRTLGFFITVTVVYLASLYVETWLVLKEYRQEGADLSRIERKP